MKNILFFPINTFWPSHFETDLELIISEIDKGNKIFFLFCNKDLRICDNNLLSDKKICNKCINIRKKALEIIFINREDKINIIPLKKYIYDFRKINNISNPQISLKNVDDLKDIFYNSFDIGYSIASSFAMLLDEAHSIDDYKEKINILYYEAILFLKCIKSIISDYSISIGYIYNGRFCFSRAFIHAFIDLNITFYTHERGSTYKKYEIFKNSFPHNIINYTNRVNNFWNNNDDFFIKKVIADLFFIKKFIGEDTDFRSYTKEQNLLQLPNDINNYKKIVTIYTSSNFEFDYVNNEYTYKFYKSQIDGIRQIINSLKNDLNIGIFLREHPNQKFRNSNFREQLKQLYAPNLHYISAESDVSSYKLLLKSNIVITFNSTMGIEATYWGIPSILCSNAMYENFNIAYKPSTHDEAINLIKSDLRPISKEDVFKYGYYHSLFGIDFQYYKPVDIWHGYFLNINLHNASVNKKRYIYILIKYKKIGKYFLKKYFPSLFILLKKIKNKI
jgi:hypothetical protein